MPKIFKLFKKPKEEGEPFDETAFRELDIDWTLHSAFTRGAPLTYNEYVNEFDNGHGASTYRRTPPYDEYLELYEKYKGKHSDSDFYFENMM